jgi:hypothetical protein
VFAFRKAMAASTISLPGSPLRRSASSFLRYLLTSNFAWISGAVLPRLPWW